MRRHIILLGLVLLATACATPRMKNIKNDARAPGVAAKEFEIEGRFAEADESYAEMEQILIEGWEIADEEQDGVFRTFFGTKLSIIAASRARCLMPENNPAGSWKSALEQYAKSDKYAARVSMTKLRRNAHRGQAHCLWPTRNAEGSWERAAELYARSAEFSKSVKDTEGRAEDLRNQALCLLEGGDDLSQVSKPIRRLLTQARTLGDPVAADLLAEAGGTWCLACGTGMAADASFCGRCGQEQKQDQEPGAPE